MPHPQILRLLHCWIDPPDNIRDKENTNLQGMVAINGVNGNHKAYHSPRTPGIRNQ